MVILVIGGDIENIKKSFTSNATFILLSNAVTVDAATKIKLNKSKATIYIGKSVY